MAVLIESRRLSRRANVDAQMRRDTLFAGPAYPTMRAPMVKFRFILGRNATKVRAFAHGLVSGFYRLEIFVARGLTLPDELEERPSGEPTVIDKKKSHKKMELWLRDSSNPSILSDYLSREYFSLNAK